MRAKRGGFTFIEVVMALVVMGIVAMIGTNVISQMYESYLRTKVVNKLQARTAQILDILSKRLSYRIKDSAVTSIHGKSGSYIKLSWPGITKAYDTLEWIGYDNEGFIGEWDGKRFSGWSGFIDLDNATAGSQTDKTQANTKGSRLDLADKSIKALSYGAISLYSKTNPAIFFKCGGFDIEPGSFGFDHGGASNIYKIKAKSADVFYFLNTASKTICEQYYLIWSAYGVVPQNVVAKKDKNGKTYYDFDLVLKYNYQPWEGESFKDGKSTLLAKHVSTFKFIQAGHTIRFKLCLRDPQTNFGFCKEKAVY